MAKRLAAKGETDRVNGARLLRFTSITDVAHWRHSQHRTGHLGRLRHEYRIAAAVSLRILPHRTALMNSRTHPALAAAFLLSVFPAAPLHAAPAAATSYYTGEKIYQARPNPDRDTPFGWIGTTGLMARVYPGVILKVEGMMPGSPAEGKFSKGEIITGINGTALKGLDPFVACGEALTKAEAGDGKMAFDVTSADGKTARRQTVLIPVLGAYSKTWPLDCAKSKKIIDQAAAFYSDPAKFKQGGIPGALACLFLLSTGEEKYLPRVKAYFDAFPKDVRAIGDHTWNNGYNGIACGEYYLRTGDTSVLPILQHYCDDAQRRQKFGRGWTHWSDEINPGYVAGGLMNPAGAQVLTTLLLGKECGVNVDEETLLGALRFFYRFAGHGTVAYGDHRGEGGLGSNGKDGMIAAAMRIAADAGGDGTAYRNASRHLALSMIDSYPLLVSGHGDDGRGDGIWRGITTSYLMKEKPALYREAMDRLIWWHDLSRESGGSIGIAMLAWENGKVGSSGPGMGLSYTAPLQTLRITGAPPTKHSKKYQLPANPWGNKADLAFLSIDHSPQYFQYGKEEPAHVPFHALGGAYHQPAKDLNTLPRETLLKNIHHRNYMIRTQAGKALRTVGAFDELEKLLGNPDPRVRRAALDGMIDYNYWFGIGRNPIPTDEFTPAMLETITKMISNPNESWWVVDGALMALKFAPAKDIHARLPLILKWADHSDWWLRESSFMALSGLEKDDALYLEILPKLIDITTREYHTQPRRADDEPPRRGLETQKAGQPRRQVDPRRHGEIHHRQRDQERPAFVRGRLQCPAGRQGVLGMRCRQRRGRSTDGAGAHQRVWHRRSSQPCGNAERQPGEPSLRPSFHSRKTPARAARGTHPNSLRRLSPGTDQTHEP